MARMTRDGAGNEAGHANTGLAAVIAGAGLIALGIGAANDTGWVAVTGGIVAGVGLVAYELVRHTKIDYEFFRRTDKSA
jgi:hypothetical protein